MDIQNITKKKIFSGTAQEIGEQVREYLQDMAFEIADFSEHHFNEVVIGVAVEKDN